MLIKQRIGSHSFIPAAIVLIVFIGSSGRPVPKSITVWMPTKVDGIVSGILKSACSKTIPLSTLILSILHYHIHRGKAHFNTMPKQILQFKRKIAVRQKFLIEDSKRHNSTVQIEYY